MREDASTETNSRVYVGNLSFDAEWPALKDLMRTAGSVLHVEILSSADGRSRGCAVVEVQS